MFENRIIASYEGVEKGPLFVCFGGVHGNERAGVHAIDLVGKMLEVEPITNPDFHYRGKFLGVRGNIQALEKGVRFIERDLNRSLTKANVERVMSQPAESLLAEDREIRDIVELIRHEIKTYQPDHMIVMDLHTTTAYGGIFTIAADDDPESIRLAVGLQAPVIMGVTKGLRGTTIEFFSSGLFDVKTTSVVFEAGQHEEALSVNRSIAAIINCMSSIGSVPAEDVENQHNYLLIEYSRNLPKVAEMVMRYEVNSDDNFVMQPNFKNFNQIKKGDLLAHDKSGPIYAPEAGLLLMPKYQDQGNDGFFIVKEILDY